MAALRTPSERTCRHCGRSEVYDEASGVWRIDEQDGRPYCVHAWDITGEFAV